MHVDNRVSQDLNSKVEKYVGLVLNHYCYLEYYFTCIKETRACSIVVPFLQINLKEFLIQVAEDIITMLSQLKALIIPSLEVSKFYKKCIVKTSRVAEKNRKTTKPYRN